MAAGPVETIAVSSAILFAAAEQCGRMDRLDAMPAFTRVMERRSFTLAAEDLAVARSTITDAVKQLEARLGVRLLQRTTRHVSPTLDGETYHRRCLTLLADPEDAEAAFGGHRMVGFHSSATGALLPFAVHHRQRLVQRASAGHGGGKQSGKPGCRRLGLIQVPRYRVERDLEGTLIPVLPDFPPSPTPVSLLHPSNRQLSPRGRVFIDWLVRPFGAGHV
jgi:DNA-binding transcriptional LysR family regulator